jgi:hypothetical protein
MSKYTETYTTVSGLREYLELGPVDHKILMRLDWKLEIYMSILLIKKPVSMMEVYGMSTH